VADAVAAFAVTLEDFISPGAAKAKASTDALRSSLAKAKTELAGYQSQLALAKELGNVEGFRKYSALVQESKQKVFDLAQATEGSAASSAAAGTSLGAVGIALGAVAVAAGVAKAAISALVDVTESLIVKSLEVVNANQLMAARFQAMGDGAEGGGKRTLAMLDGLAAKLPQSREHLAEWTNAIQKMGITDLSKIRTELIATASAEALLGEGGAGAYEKISRKVNDAIEGHHALKITSKELTRTIGTALSADVASRLGMSLKDLETKLKAGTVDAEKFGDALSKAVTEKGKGPLEAMSNSLGALKTKASEAFAHLFDDVDTKPLTDAFHNLIAVIDQGQPSGQAMKMGITGALNAIIRVVGHGITEAEVFFLRLEVGALSAYIALKPVISAVSKIASAMGSLGNMFGGAASAVGGVAAGPAGADPAVAQESGKRIGLMMLSGLDGGIGQMANLVGQMVGDFANAKSLEVAHQSGVQLGQATVAGMREGVQAHSPSVAAMRIGMDLGAGLGLGMQASPEPAAAARTISNDALGGLRSGQAGIGAGGAANTNNTNTIAIHINAPEGVTDAHELSVVGLSAALERFQVASGR